MNEERLSQVIGVTAAQPDQIIEVKPERPGRILVRRAKPLPAIPNPLSHRQSFARIALNREDIRFNRATWQAQQKLGFGIWRTPLYGRTVLRNDQGYMCASVREHALDLPRNGLCYCTFIKGVGWSMAGVGSAKRNFWYSRGYPTLDEARAAVEAARWIILTSDESDALP